MSSLIPQADLPDLEGGLPAPHKETVEEKERIKAGAATTHSRTRA
jgi:hypothetical protein